MSELNYYFDDQHPLKPFTHNLEANPGSLPPTNAVRVALEIEDGFWPCWDGEKWIQVEDHRGLTGWMDGQPFTIEALGPLPEGWSVEPPEPTPEEIKESRIEAIKAELLTLDLASIRPLRSLMEGTATPEDQTRLDSIEVVAKELRLELKGLIHD